MKRWSSIRTIMVMVAFLVAVTIVSGAYDLSEAVESDSQEITGVSTDFNTGLDISGNGEYILMTGRGPGDGQETYQIFLDTPYEIAVWTLTEAPLTEQIYPEDITMSDDGEHVYRISWIGGATTYSSIVSWNLSTPYNLSTATGSSALQTFGFNRGSGIAIGKNGTRLYVTDYNQDHIRQYDLSTPHDLSTATNTKNYTVGRSLQDVEVSAGGSYLYAIGGGLVTQYRLTTPFEINSALFDYTFAGGGRGVSLSPGGTRLYEIDGDNITQYDMPGSSECIPDWSCSGYAACVYPSTTASCVSVVDETNCLDTYAGDFSEFSTLTCTYSGGGGGGSTDTTSPETGPSDFLNEDNPVNTDNEDLSSGTTTDLTTTDNDITQDERPSITVGFEFERLEELEDELTELLFPEQVDKNATIVPLPSTLYINQYNEFGELVITNRLDEEKEYTVILNRTTLPDFAPFNNQSSYTLDVPARQSLSGNKRFVQYDVSFETYNPGSYVATFNLMNEEGVVMDSASVDVIVRDDWLSRLFSALGTRAFAGLTWMSIIFFIVLLIIGAVAINKAPKGVILSRKQRGRRR